MTGSDFLTNLAEFSAALLQDYDLPGMLVRTTSEAVAVADADAGGLLVLTDAGELELLSATSHSAVALETYQAFSGEGPCVACLESQGPLGFTRTEVAQRWPTIGMLMATTEYEYVLAAPLRWRGTALGGLNLFWTAQPDDVDTVQAETQVFADMLALFIVNSEPITPTAARRLVRAALEMRAVIEQAKGVLAVQENLDMSAAYLRLRELERVSGLSITEVARDILSSAQAGVPARDAIEKRAEGDDSAERE
ncbi:ANTAR domain-containing protein [Nocardioides carbamazepini]|uniref:ANTAR domain-containing protein n=1 Tax=Nocardioides carbamazepini TaxID=2854259 RepID=UPI00214A4EF8|nr:ANTAR domain-containing protein [Nocardioides carbamazepini]MCR1785270.1 ANTAR domain-containing protein [Nocardioides carbamazepini]